LVKAAAAGRSALFFILVSLCSVPFLVLYPFYFVVPARWAWPFIAGYLRMMLFMLRWACGLSYEIEGLEHIPAGACLLASRHESAWETLFFPIFFGDPAFFVKKEVFSYPIAGSIARKNRHIFVDRTGDLETARAALRSAQAQAASGRSVCIFPSGTRQAAGQLKLRTGVAALYALLDVPCVPIVLDSGRYWPRGSWWTYPGTIHVRVLPPISPGLPKKTFLAVLAEKLSEPASGD
jgi:1-acyl-sn-glycerol-3-phosphate acyltransferase